MLESELAKPKNVFACPSESVTLSRLAASYASGMATNDPFVDGNKRTAMVVAFVFLEINGYEVIPSPQEAYFAFLAVASCETTEEELTQWLDDPSTRQ